MGILSEFYQNSINILSEFFVNSYVILTEFFGNSFGVVFEFFGDVQLGGSECVGVDLVNLTQSET